MSALTPSPETSMRRLKKLPLLVLVLLLSASSPALYACSDDGTGSRCRICREGKACGDSCIARDLQCNVGPGCACNG